MRKQIALQFLVSNLHTVISFLLTVILARLLTPEEIGVFSMSAVLVAIAAVFRDFGVTAFLKSEKEVTEQTIRTAYGLLYVSSTLVAALMFFSAPFWAAFYRESRVEEVIYVLALGFLFIPFGAVPATLIIREMDAVKGAKVGLSSICVYFGASIALALWGCGHMTMAWANLVNILFNGLACHWVLGRRLPAWPSLAGWRRLTNFGLANVLTSLAKAINTSLPDILLGRLGTPSQVGLLSRANATASFAGKVIEGPVGFFTLPYMARLHNASGDVAATYIRIASIINSIMLPALIWVAFMADDFVRLLFGTTWLEAASAVPWLCVAVGISTLFSISTHTVVGVGRPYVALFPLLLVISGKIGAVALLFDGTLARFAMAMAAGEAISIPAYALMLRRHIRLPLGAWTRDLLRTATISLATYVALAIIVAGLSLLETHIVARLALTGAAAALIAAAGNIVLGLPLGDELRRLICRTSDALKERRG
jgi:O-antigen/teichoic acid export membrane protein